MSACCGPSRPQTSEIGPVRVSERKRESSTDGMVRLPAGAFRMGSTDDWSYAGDGEGPVHEVALSPIRIEATAVSNADFAAFIEATGYVTDAERYEWSFVFGGLLPDDFEM